MTFAHKLSKRLAMCRGALLALGSLAALPACGRTSPNPLDPAERGQLVVTPDRIALDYQQTVAFRALLRSASGDTTAAAVQWQATGGRITELGVYAADTVPGDFTVTATDTSGLSDTVDVGVGYSAATLSTNGARRPGTVTDLAVSSPTSGGFTLTFTEVDDGAGQPADYELRDDTGGFSWSGATPVTAGTCATPVAGTAIGAKRSCTVTGLRPATGYGFRMVAIRGTLGVDAVLGKMSNLAKGTTLDSAATAAPVASVTVSPASASLAVSQTVQLSAVTKDSAGNVLTGRSVSWTSSDASVAVVSGSGLATGVGAGSAVVTATSEGRSGGAAVSVSAPSGSSPCTPTGSGTCYYVDPSAGNDGNSGSSTAPFRTLQKAAGVTNPGDVVIARDGIYTGGSVVLSVTRSGTASNLIVFRAEHQWGAVIDGQSNASTTGVQLAAAYVRLEGFEIRNTSRYGVEAYSGSGASHDLQVAMNHIHDIGRVCTDDSGGRVGVDAYATNLVVERNVMHDIGRLGPGEQGCSPTTAYWQNHDHGIYHGDGNNLVIRNNLFYNFTRGWAIQRYSGSGTVLDGLSILNNTFAFPNPNKDGQIIIATATTNLVIANNIFYQPRTAGIWFDVSGLSGVSVSHNLSYGGAISTGTTAGITLTANVTGVDPRFVDLGALDFHLQAGSPAIDIGLALPGVTNDLAGVTRPQGLGYDVGSYEYR